MEPELLPEQKKNSACSSAAALVRGTQLSACAENEADFGGKTITERRKIGDLLYSI